MAVFVIIPAHNEENNIKDVIEKVKKYASNIVVVDDGSNDCTGKVAKEEKVFVLRHLVNLGKGAAVRTGCDFALKNGAKQVILIDADGQHNPDKIPDFLERLKETEVVMGYRELSPTMPSILKFGNWFISKATKYLYRIDLKDTQCGYRAFNTNVYPKIKWKSCGYFMESEMIANIGKNKIKYKQIEIETIYSDKYKGTTIFDGIKIVLNLLIWRIRKWD